MTELPSTIVYWTQGDARANFGDYLSEVLFRGFFVDRPLYDNARVHLIGSVIAPSQIRASLKAGASQIVFWGCGARRKAPLRRDLRDHAVILGARGPLSRDCLGLPANTPLGDSALLLPRIVKPKPDPETAGRTLCAPHIDNPTDDATLLRVTGADRVLRMAIEPNDDACRRVIDAIASADFVLCGALHAAIVAYAYGVPFAFYDAPVIDVPFKWADFAASIGFECTFARTVSEGVRIHRRNAPGRPVVSPERLLETPPFALQKTSTRFAGPKRQQAGMKIAVVTPYCRESPAVLQRCVKSVRAQTIPCDHFLVADGHPLPAISNHKFLKHIVLPSPHGDNGNVARTVGGLAAAAQGYDAIAYLDADNGFMPDHLESLIELQAATGTPLVASWRSFFRPDGSRLAVLSEEEERGDLVDTSCWLVTRPAFDLLDAWLMPLPLSPVCDRVFFATTKFRGHAFASTRRRTVLFTTTYRYHYELAEEEPPADAKSGVRQAAHDWLQEPANRSETAARLGFVPRL